MVCSAADSAECSAASKVHHVIGTIQTIDCQLVDCKDAKGFISRGILPKLNADSDEQNWQPVVLTNTHVQNWEALGGKNSKKKWTLQRLAERHSPWIICLSTVCYCDRQQHRCGSIPRQSWPVQGKVVSLLRMIHIHS